MTEDCIESSTFEEDYEGSCLRYIDVNSHFPLCTDAYELMKHNEDLQDKLGKVQDESRCIGTSSTLTRDQQDLLRIYETYNHVMYVDDT